MSLDISSSHLFVSNPDFGLSKELLAVLQPGGTVPSAGYTLDHFELPSIRAASVVLIAERQKLLSGL
jgi:hypothetical protein